MRREEWFGLYAESWGDDLHPDAFSHPAKVQPALARRIYEHALDRGYLRPGDTVLDPFAGVAGFARHAMQYGLHYIGVELEPRFVELAARNIARWEAHGRWFVGPGTAVVLQGDSRRLAEVVATAGALISSPPFGAAETRDRSSYQPGEIASFMGRAYTQDRQGETPGNLAHLEAGDLDAAISSPPYASAIDGTGEGPGARYDSIYHAPENANKKSSANGYGTTAGNLGGMVEEGPDPLETFWSAARLIVEQVYHVLRPGGYAIWVCGDYVRDGRRVAFGEQWLALCRACGFEPVEWITAWKVEHHGTQLDLWGNGHEKKTERLSFFRRLANRRNPAAAVENEDVIIVRKPLFSAANNGNGHQEAG